MNLENDKTKSNLESSVKASIKMMDEYVQSIIEAEYPEDLKQDIINLFTNAREELISVSSLNNGKTEEE
tara:strand:+ start:234 stop:440 length:207 start_codon:yes stop_codon:yes gene_type:complete